MAQTQVASLPIAVFDFGQDRRFTFSTAAAFSAVIASPMNASSISTKRLSR